MAAALLRRAAQQRASSRAPRTPAVPRGWSPTQVGATSAAERNTASNISPLDRQRSWGPLRSALAMAVLLTATAAAAAWVAQRTRDPHFCYPSRCDDPYLGMSPRQREEARVGVGDGGALHRVVGGQRREIEDGVYRYVVQPARGVDGDAPCGVVLRVDVDGNAETHADLGDGRRALLAGFIRFEGGEAVAIDRNSGHYAPTEQHLCSTVAALSEAGLVSDETRVCPRGRGVLQAE